MTDSEAFEASIAKESWFRVLNAAKDDDDEAASVFRMCRMAAHAAWNASRKQALEEAAARFSGRYAEYFPEDIPAAILALNTP